VIVGACQPHEHEPLVVPRVHSLRADVLVANAPAEDRRKPADAWAVP
jgi:hypothetical protein